MQPAIHRRLTAEEFFWLAAPDAKELVDGDPIAMPPAFFRHGQVARRFVQALGEYADRSRAGEVVTAEVGFVTRRTPDRVRAPDVAFVAAARLAGQDLEGAFFDGAPDLAVEVLSPGDRASEVVAKVAEYLAAGARLVWVADPQSATVTAYRPGGAAVTLGPDDVLDGADVLPGFARRVRELLGG